MSQGEYRTSTDTARYNFYWPILSTRSFEHYSSMDEPVVSDVPVCVFVSVLSLFYIHCS